MNINFRIAKLLDLERIVEIYNQAIETKNSTADMTPFTAKEKLEWFEEHLPEKYPIYVAESDEEIVGWLSLSPYRKGREALDRTAEISYYLDNRFQRMGIGSEILKFSIEESRKFGFKNLIAILIDSNIGSIKLLEKFEFERWGYLPNILEFGERVQSHLYYGKKL